jgi:hypothetical protein
MLDGFNEDWIDFVLGPGGSRKGKITLIGRVSVADFGPAKLSA